ncbi:MAG: dihydrolipoyl dehydrogenase [Acidimicrobiales bacterium]|nr:dihydrolipoyl dehydrogenase [Acidimicrobiales bacterium]
MADQVSKHQVVIVGGGPGGYAAALYGASAGLDIALIEKAKVGGTCLHVGCIPAKELLETASVFRHIRHAAEFGVTAGEPSLDWSVTMARKQRIIDQLAGGLGTLLKKRKVTVYQGTGRLAADHTVTVTGDDGTSTTLSGDHVILAAGSVPRTIPGFDIDGRLVVTSDELLSIDRLPASAIVIGGGAIGCEFASMMADLGTEVTILEAMPKILPGCDKDVADVVVRSFKKRGITIRTGVPVAGHSPDPSGATTTVSFGEGESLQVELVVVSVGRRPFPDLLGLDGSGVDVDQRGFVQVDELCRTTAGGIYALGDLIATPQLAHIAFVEGMTVIKDILGESPLPIDYEKIPWAIYCHPEVAFAGYSEEQAVAKGYDVVTSKHRHNGNGRAMIIGETEGLVKVIAEKRPDGTGGRILGVHMVGPWATEQLGQGYLAVNWEATADEVAHFIQPHPTISELFGESMLSLTGRSLH